MKKAKKNFDEKKAKKIRVIVSAILLVLFAIGWIIYGISLLRTNDKTILKSVFTVSKYLHIRSHITAPTP